MGKPKENKNKGLQKSLFEFCSSPQIVHDSRNKKNENLFQKLPLENLIDLDIDSEISDKHNNSGDSNEL